MLIQETNLCEKELLQKHDPTTNFPDQLVRSSASSDNVDSALSQEVQSDCKDTRTLTTALLNVKSIEQVRQRYLSKLFDLGLLRNGIARKHQSIIIFDWDDTLFCTSYIGAFRPDDIPFEVKQTVAVMEKQAIKMLECAARYGQVFIITNAIRGWVHRSCKLFMPRFLAFLEGNRNIQVVSARELHETRFPGDHLRWKIEAFQQIGKRYHQNVITNIISVGDSTIEGEAADHLSQFFAERLLKTIKMRENPSPEELIKQLQLIYHSFDEIHGATKNLTIKLEKKRQNSSPP